MSLDRTGKAYLLHLGYSIIFEELSGQLKYVSVLGLIGKSSRKNTIIFIKNIV